VETALRRMATMIESFADAFVAWLGTEGARPQNWPVLTWVLIGAALVLLWWLARRRRPTPLDVRPPQLLVTNGEVIPHGSSEPPPRGRRRPVEPSSLAVTGSLVMTVSNLSRYPVQLLEVALRENRRGAPDVAEVNAIVPAMGSASVEAVVPLSLRGDGWLDVYSYATVPRHKTHRHRVELVWEPWAARFKVAPLDQVATPTRRLAGDESNARFVERASVAPMASASTAGMATSRGGEAVVEPPAARATTPRTVEVPAPPSASTEVRPADAQRRPASATASETAAARAARVPKAQNVDASTPKAAPRPPVRSETSAPRPVEPQGNDRPAAAPRSAQSRPAPSGASPPSPADVPPASASSTTGRPRTAGPRDVRSGGAAPGDGRPGSARPSTVRGAEVYLRDARLPEARVARPRPAPPTPDAPADDGVPAARPTSRSPEPGLPVDRRSDPRPPDQASKTEQRPAPRPRPESEPDAVDVETPPTGQGIDGLPWRTDPGVSPTPRVPDPTPDTRPPAFERWDQPDWLSARDMRTDEGASIGRTGRPRTASRPTGAPVGETRGSAADARRSEPSAAEPELLSESEWVPEPDLLLEPDLLEPDLLLDDRDAGAATDASRTPDAGRRPVPDARPVVPRIPSPSSPDPSKPARPRRKLEFPDEF
jgi:hypothetical protein